MNLTVLFDFSCFDKHHNQNQLKEARAYISLQLIVSIPGKLVQEV